MSSETDTTSQRIIEAAGQIFAAKGFEAATVREICNQAEANIAAVNYHFGDKQRLYIEAVKRAHRGRELQFPMPAWGPEATAETRLADFIVTLLKRMTSPDGGWEGELMSREISRPTEACAELARESIRPHFAMLNDILAELIPGAEELERHLTAFSIVGQCLHYKFADPVIRQLVSEEEYASYEVELLARHITDFSLRSLRARAANHEPDQGTRR